ncbi:methyl-accepting chemotaxis protein [Salibacterium qingdaonense]|uniref:Methyl-accepting chemotaxis protein n=1 Tax=Salibacterium qingdaonense TaxID=266892 RepID=A0A1I4KM42_9BACI|nr:HAMP domain-containing methyl-accepting chemotaxis protein [Salibacterium qingdaonense]SFL79517.1 methyl-accepting chemotaxis protein [Salibacterium qingdaonense]
MIKNIWQNRSIGGKYAFVFVVVILTFVLSLLVTYKLLSQTNDSVQETRVKNSVVQDASSLMSLYQQKYLNIPEYMIMEDEAGLENYLSLSEEFTATAKRLRGSLETEEQISVINQIIENNHALDEYYFSEIVPNVQQINTETFTELQNSAQELKEETMVLGESLQEEAAASNNDSIVEAENSIHTSLLILVISVIVSIIISTALLFFISRSIRKSLTKVVETSNEIAHGNLEADDLEDDRKDEIGRLSSSINDMKTSLKGMIVEVSTLAGNVDEKVQTFSRTSGDVKETSEQVAVTIEELAAGASSQANEATSISEQMQDLNQQITDASENGEQLTSYSQDVHRVSIDGDAQMQESLEQMTRINDMVETSMTKMKDLEKQTNSISEFVHVIQDIAEQTNLLALNASIEAARAGEAGKGFAVVADEVRKLAEQVTSSADSITKIVNSIKDETGKMVTDMTEGYEEVNKGKSQIETSGAYFSEIKEKVSNMVERVSEISNSLASFHSASQDISRSVEHIASISEESAAGTEEISASVNDQQESIHRVSSGADELKQMVERMNGLIQHFDIQSDFRHEKTDMPDAVYREEDQ